MSILQYTNRHLIEQLLGAIRVFKQGQKGTIMEVMVFIILIGVIMIDAKIWKIVTVQRNHNRAVEALLAEIRDRSAPKWPYRTCWPWVPCSKW
jgi:hypothetical protein